MLKKYNCKIPIKNEEIKNKIKTTMKNHYGSDWFLCRGKHYKKIEDIMLKKYNVTNLFYSEDFKNEYTYKHINTLVSKLESKIFESLLTKCNFLEPNCYFISKKQTFFKNPITGRNYYVDFYDKKLNLIIEVLGDFWHCNPEKYSENYIHPYLKMTAKEIWEKDNKRKQEIINLTGAEFIEIWEKDWMKNFQYMILYLKNKYKI